MIATVPGTVLACYFNAGAVPDPNFGDNQVMISDSFFYADFWYRTEFVGAGRARRPARLAQLRRHQLEGRCLPQWREAGPHRGRIHAGRFDVTGKLHPGEKNVLAVRVRRTPRPAASRRRRLETTGKNGGALGADNPTFHCLRRLGLDSHHSRAQHRHLERRLADRHRAGHHRRSIRENDAAAAGHQQRRRVASMSPCTITTAQASERNAARSLRRHDLRTSGDAGAFREPGRSTSLLHLQNPKLWWPIGYGEPNLYDVEVNFETGGAVSDSKSFKAGVRQFTYSEEGGALKIWINGRRFIARGGNWGFGESMLRYRAREYRRRGALSPRHELHHDPQLGGPDRRRRILRGLRPVRHHGLAGFLAGQSLGRPGSRRQCHVPSQRRRFRSQDSQPSLRRPVLRPQRRLPARRSSKRHPQDHWPNCIPACTTFPVRPTTA